VYWLIFFLPDMVGQISETGLLSPLRAMDQGETASPFPAMKNERFNASMNWVCLWLLLINEL